MPDGAVFVGRPTRWGNRWKVGDDVYVRWYLNASEQAERSVEITAELAVALYRSLVTVDADFIRESLAGRDLACWCPLEDDRGNRVPCHADVLLELANPGLLTLTGGGV